MGLEDHRAGDRGSEYERGSCNPQADVVPFEDADELGLVGMLKLETA